MSLRPPRPEPLLADEWTALGDLVTELVCGPCGRHNRVIGELRRHRTSGVLYGRVESVLPLDKTDREACRAAGQRPTPLLLVSTVPAAELESAWCRFGEHTVTVPTLNLDDPPLRARCVN